MKETMSSGQMIKEAQTITPFAYEVICYENGRVLRMWWERWGSGILTSHFILFFFILPPRYFLVLSHLNTQ